MGNLQPYVSKRKKGDPVRIWFWKICEMSQQGFKNWARSIRPHIRRSVFRFVGHPVFVDTSEINSPEAIEHTAINVIGFEGSFYMMMPCHSKNSFRVSYKKRAVVRIVDSEEGLKAFVSDCSKMSHYWFWIKR
jgi:hypothetical protein